ncbi:MAG: hypothetical protein ACRC6V_04045 [Bacteroidales bacterium]
MDVYDVLLTFDKPLVTFSHLFFLRSNIQEEVLEVQESIHKESLALRRAERLIVNCTEAEEKLRHEHTMAICPKRLDILNARKYFLEDLLSICDSRLEKFKAAGIDSRSCITSLRDHAENIDEGFIRDHTDQTARIE